MRRPFHLNESSTVRVNLWRYSSVAFKSIEITICLQSAELASTSNGAHCPLAPGLKMSQI